MHRVGTRTLCPRQIAGDTMTQINRTKMLAILVVAAMALVPVFAVIDSSDSSASGESQVVEVEDWDSFKKAMNDARESVA